MSPYGLYRACVMYKGALYLFLRLLKVLTLKAQFYYFYRPLNFESPGKIS